eukprot:Hpha_TRINITY_DN14602_c0_g1::TRINITY_DN14602_c0_g1_i1::g.47945::m.47945
MLAARKVDQHELPARCAGDAAQCMGPATGIVHSCRCGGTQLVRVGDQTAEVLGASDLNLHARVCICRTIRRGDKLRGCAPVEHIVAAVTDKFDEGERDGLTPGRKEEILKGEALDTVHGEGFAAARLPIHHDSGMQTLRYHRFDERLSGAHVHLLVAAHIPEDGVKMEGVVVHEHACHVRLHARVVHYDACGTPLDAGCGNDVVLTVGGFVREDRAFPNAHSHCAVGGQRVHGSANGHAALFAVVLPPAADRFFEVLGVLASCRTLVYVLYALRIRIAHPVPLLAWATRTRGVETQKSTETV